MLGLRVLVMRVPCHLDLGCDQDLRESLRITVIEDGCPEAGGDSTGLKTTGLACNWEFPEEGSVSCEPTME